MLKNLKEDFDFHWVGETVTMHGEWSERQPDGGKVTKVLVFSCSHSEFPKALSNLIHIELSMELLVQVYLHPVYWRSTSPSDWQHSVKSLMSDGEGSFPSHFVIKLQKTIKIPKNHPRCKKIAAKLFKTVPKFPSVDCRIEAIGKANKKLNLSNLTFYLAVDMSARGIKNIQLHFIHIPK